MNWNTSTNFKPHDAGNFYAVCVDVYDKVEKNYFFGKTDKEGKLDTRETIKTAYVVFFTSTGETVRFRASATLGKPDKQSNLRKFIKGWNPKITDAMLSQFDPNVMLGWPACTVAHKDSNGNIYANVVNAVAPPPGSPIPTIPADYLRENDKATAQPVATSPVADGPPPHTLADMPAHIKGEDEDDLSF